MLSLNFHHLRYFWVITQLGSLTAAAKRLNVSASSLSTQLKELEHRCGGALFIRDARKLTLTETGRLVLDHCEIIFRTGEELSQALGKKSGKRALSIRIGSVATLSRNFQIEFLRPLYQRTDIEIELKSAALSDLLSGLRDHTIDIVLSNLPAPHDAETGWHSTLLHQEAVSLVSTSAGDHRRIKFPDALRTTSVMLPTVHSNIRVAFDQLMAQHNIEPIITAEVDDMSMLRLLASVRPGLTLVPPVAVRDELRSGLLIERCRIPELQERFYAITRDRRFPNPLVGELLLAAPMNKFKKAKKGRVAE
jgi:LysR family transcriptional regulator, transcriptional activator of nhaA